MPFLLIPSLGWMRVVPALPRDGQAEADEARWQEMERRGQQFDGTQCGIKYSRKPHPRSYRPDIPLGSLHLERNGKKIPSVLTTLTKAEKELLAGREIVWR